MPGIAAFFGLLFGGGRWKIWLGLAIALAIFVGIKYWEHTIRADEHAKMTAQIEQEKAKSDADYAEQLAAIQKDKDAAVQKMKAQRDAIQKKYDANQAQINSGKLEDGTVAPVLKYELDQLRQDHANPDVIVDESALPPAQDSSTPAPVLTAPVKAVPAPAPAPAPKKTTKKAAPAKVSPAPAPVMKEQPQKDELPAAPAPKVTGNATIDSWIEKSKGMFK